MANEALRDLTDAEADNVATIITSMVNEYGCHIDQVALMVHYDRHTGTLLFSAVYHAKLWRANLASFINSWAAGLASANATILNQLNPARYRPMRVSYARAF